MELFGIWWECSYLFIPLFIGFIFFTLVVLYQLYSLQKRVLYLTGSKKGTNVIQHFSLIKKRIASFLTIFSGFFLMLALLQPQWGQKETTAKQEGREVFIALDVSRSMLAADFKPDRLTFAKSKIQRLVSLLHADRVGLILFSGSAVVQCPLTRDIGLFNLFLKNVDVQTIASGTTSLYSAVQKTIEIIKKVPTRKHKLLVVFTDGEDFSENFETLEKEAEQLGLMIFTYGVGTSQGAPVPIVDDNGTTTGYEKNENGSVVISKLNRSKLQTISEKTGAYYINPTQSNHDIKGLADKVSQFEKEQFEDKTFNQKQEKYFYFLVVAFVCLLLRFII